MCFFKKEKSIEWVKAELESLANDTTNYSTGTKAEKRKEILALAPLDFLIERAATIASNATLDNLAAQVELEKRKNRLAFKNYITAKYTLWSTIIAVIIALIALYKSN